MGGEESDGTDGTKDSDGHKEDIRTNTDSKWTQTSPKGIRNSKSVQHLKQQQKNQVIQKLKWGVPSHIQHKLQK